MKTKNIFLIFILAVFTLSVSQTMAQIKKSYYPNGKLKSETPYMDGEENGILKEYYESGKLKSETSYIDGKAVGVAKKYNDSEGLESTIPNTGQLQPVDVADLTIKVGALGSEELFYCFASGDQIVFNFEDLKGKELKELEIIELPNSSKFMDYKTTKIVDKKITVHKKSVYQFKFSNSAIAGRICKIKIQRIPKSQELVNFNTDWKWKTLYDTTYVPYTQDSIVSHDTLRYKEKVKELVKTENNEELIFDKPQRVNSGTNSNGPKSWLFFPLPKNETTTYKTTRVISWAYWIGVGEEANQAWKKNITTVGNLAKGAAAVFTSPLGALAVGAVTDLMIPTIGEDVTYSITNAANKDLFMANLQYTLYDKGKGVAGFRKFTDKNLCQGTYFVCLYNDNTIQEIDATVKVIAIIETKTYEDKEYDRMKTTPKYVTLNKRRMVVNTSQIRVNAD